MEASVVLSYLRFPWFLISTSSKSKKHYFKNSCLKHSLKNQKWCLYFRDGFYGIHFINMSVTWGSETKKLYLQKPFIAHFECALFKKKVPKWLFDAIQEQFLQNDSTKNLWNWKNLSVSQKLYIKNFWRNHSYKNLWGHSSSDLSMAAL